MKELTELKDLQSELDKASTKQCLYVIAGKLNNWPEHINVDKVTCLGFMEFNYAKVQVQRMIDLSLKKYS